MIQIEPLGVMPLTKEIVSWLKNGKRDVSSETIVSVLTGVMILREGTHPTDFNQFDSIFNLIYKEPIIKEKFHYMKFVDRNWKNITENFNDIENWYNECSTSDKKGTASHINEVFNFNEKIKNILNK